MKDFEGPNEELLKSGNNELQALIFEAGDQLFAVNVAKLDELIMPPETRRWPGQHAAVLGAFNLRQQNIALVDLGYYIKPHLGFTENGNTVIITNFNKDKTAFLVKSVSSIKSVDWGMVGPPAGNTGSDGIITGIMKFEDKMIPLLDFEAIHDDIAGIARVIPDEAITPNNDTRMVTRVAIAEDSRYMRNMVVALLNRAGFDQVEAFADGQAALDALLDRDENERPHILITDIEMPRLDGLTLTRRLKQSGQYLDVPIILFSSIINDASLHRGLRAGADAQINKGDLSQLLPAIDQLLWTSYGEGESPGADADAA